MAKVKKSKKQMNIQQELHRLGVVVERVDGNVRVVAEQYGDIKKTLDGHTKILHSHSEILHSHSEMIAKLMVNIEIMKTDIEFIKTGLKKKVDVDEFAALERRVANLERKR